MRSGIKERGTKVMTDMRAVLRGHACGLAASDSPTLP